MKNAKEASRRFNSFNSNALAGRYGAWVAVLERTQIERVHFHLVVVCPVDIRTGFDFAAVKRRDYTSACQWLRSEWAFLRGALEKYGFGKIHELMPIKTDGGTVGRYLGKYLGKSFKSRLKVDRGVRRVRYSAGFPRIVVGPFCPIGYRAYRQRCGGFARFWHLDGEDGMKAKFGGRWRWTFREVLSPSQTSADRFVEILMYAKESLKYFDGLEFAILDACEQVRKRLNNSSKS